MPHCPFCSSDKVYRLLDTLRCKRCKNIWKEGGDSSAVSGPAVPDTSLRIRKRTEPLEKRMAKKLDECLTRCSGKFCITTIAWQASDISEELFRRYIRQCVKNRTLAETKDSYGRTWYSRHGTKSKK
ncbi:MAG: hypothetical protein M0R30_13280 [Methanoregula sp.]|uniref:hypothetical protein n=1 Tax=Methanoregula sp. TaxID=2052170 RepID=UPI0025D30053|nr:hypothetical protein [Methanoregula sp.]MCK9632598.1 hypothetical protein [Methanoregula sp.]